MTSMDKRNRIETWEYRARILPIRRLNDLRESLEGAYQQGLFDEEFYRQRLTEFVFEPPAAPGPAARSLVIAAYRDPPVRFTFVWKGNPVQAIVPPTYLHWREKDERAAQALVERLQPEGRRLIPADVPKKLLAVQSGLAAYGSNNITYVKGLGSFFRLAAFFSDLPCAEDFWTEPRRLEACNNCRICRLACPTGAIAEERFLLHAERCLTYWNEKPATISFPDWLAGGWHNCLVGCQRCQTVCPENRIVLDRVEDGGRFTEQETMLLLEHLPQAELPSSLVEKLESWDLLELEDILPRNLRALLAARK
jgi:epoxyqueuosine reductase